MFAVQGSYSTSVVDLHTTFAQVLGTQPKDSKRTKAVQTDPVVERINSSLMPMSSDDQHIQYPRTLAPPIRPYFAFYPVKRFADKHWEQIWGEPTLVLDLYVSSIKPASSEKDREMLPTYFHPENEFTGINYRVIFDETRTHEPVYIKSGDSVDILRTNMYYARYIVDSCQLI